VAEERSHTSLSNLWCTVDAVEVEGLSASGGAAGGDAGEIVDAPADLMENVPEVRPEE